MRFLLICPRIPRNGVPQRWGTGFIKHQYLFAFRRTESPMAMYSKTWRIVRVNFCNAILLTLRACKNNRQQRILGQRTCWKKTKKVHYSSSGSPGATQDNKIEGHEQSCPGTAGWSSFRPPSIPLSNDGTPWNSPESAVMTLLRTQRGYRQHCRENLDFSGHSCALQFFNPQLKDSGMLFIAILLSVMRRRIHFNVSSGNFEADSWLCLVLKRMVHRCG